MRVKILRDYAHLNFPATPLLDYATLVEKITTSKVFNVELRVSSVEWVWSGFDSTMNINSIVCCLLSLCGLIVLADNTILTDLSFRNIISKHKADLHPVTAAAQHFVMHMSKKSVVSRIY